MVDQLGLCKQTVPLQERYDAFVRWISSKNHNVPEILAEEIGVSASVIDVFFELGNLDSDEFETIDRKAIDIGALFIIVRSKKNIRLKVYSEAENLLSSPQPLKAIRDFIDNEKVDLEGLLHTVSGEAWASLANYLKSRGINENVINASFRSMLMNAKKKIQKGERMTDNMIDWTLQCIAYDSERKLGIFSNDTLKKKHPDDFKTLGTVIDSITIHIA